jgi:hypothetical protein
MITIKELREKQEYKTIAYMICALAEMCAGEPLIVIDKLTDYLWDDNEAEQIEKYIKPV